MSGGAFSDVWWRRGESNSRPRTIRESVYRFRSGINVRQMDCSGPDGHLTSPFKCFATEATDERMLLAL